MRCQYLWRIAARLKMLTRPGLSPLPVDPFARKIKIRKASDFNRRNGLNGRNRPSQNPDPHFLNGF
jgi:hypothetical protein